MDGEAGVEPVDADRDEFAVDNLDVVGKGGIPVENEDLFGISIIFIIRMDLIVDTPVRVFWLATREGKMGLSCMLGISRVRPAK